MTKRMIIMLIVVGVIFGLIFGFIGFRNHMIAKFMAARGFPPQTVATTVAVYDQWQPKLQSVGSLRAINGADLSSEVNGIVSAIHFESGADVKAGTALIELAQADDVAKLQSLKAAAALAQITLDRDEKQLKVQGVSQQTVDADSQTLKADLAQVAQQQATLDYKTIRAPFDGRLGIRQVDIGQYLAAGTTVVTLQSLDPIYADFYMPQQAIAQLKAHQKINVTVDTYPGKTFAGEISTINPKVDVATRNVQVRATLKNPDGILLPGMFATLTIDAGEQARYITLPQTAIVHNSFGDNVYIVDNKSKDAKGQPALTVRQVFVTTGDVRGDQIAVLTGVKDGDQVVTAGQIKLRAGAPIIIDNSVLPTNDPNPKPIDH